MRFVVRLSLALIFFIFHRTKYSKRFVISTHNNNGSFNNDYIQGYGLGLGNVDIGSAIEYLWYVIIDR